ncbi:hypothetical protein [Rubritalea tangerina]|uniref:hypothetical protein n=1 Tax=Rubritalea tangerina TaxID=430798 RepID=UPI003608D177
MPNPDPKAECGLSGSIRAPHCETNIVTHLTLNLVHRQKILSLINCLKDRLFIDTYADVYVLHLEYKILVHSKNR